MKYAIVYQDSYYVEGDERSRTNPGHGYPGHTVTFDTMKQFDSLEDLKKWVSENSNGYSPKKFQAFQLTPLNVSTEVSVTVKLATREI